MEDLTQQDLALRAFGDETHKGQISALERGRIPNPQQRTIDALVIALQITQEELDACHYSRAEELPLGIREELGLADGLIENLALRFGHDNPDAGRAKLLHFLKQKAKEHSALKARLDSLAAFEVRIANQIGEAKGAIEAGDFDAAEQILAYTEGMQQAEHTLIQIEKQAEIRAARATAALLRGDVETAHAHFSVAAKFFESFDQFKAARDRYEYSGQLYAHGERYGDAGLLGAIELAERNIEFYAKDRQPVLWARTQARLGMAHCLLGFRQTNKTHLNEAAICYGRALQVLTQAIARREWAEAQSGLGLALRLMGERDKSNELLEGSIAALRHVLTDDIRTEFPLIWAEAQHHLGSALWRIGEREGVSSRLTEAVTSFHLSLEIRKRETSPLDWATSQNGLGLALWSLGEVEGDLTHFRGAVSAFSAALEERTQEWTPLDWAATQNNLGNALRNLGEIDFGTDHLKQAVSAFEAALKVYGPDTAPAHWAATQHNLGNTFVAIGKRDRDTNILHQAIHIFRKAIMSTETMQSQIRLAYGNHCLGEAYLYLGKLENNQQAISEASEFLGYAINLYIGSGEENWRRHATILLIEARDILRPELS